MINRAAAVNAAIFSPEVICSAALPLIKAPNAATPIAPPTCRAALSTAEATPDLARSTLGLQFAKRIGIDHPLELGHGRPQIFTDPGKGDVNNGYVELNYREGKATGRYNPRHRASWSIWGHEIAWLHRGAIRPIYRIRLHNGVHRFIFSRFVCWTIRYGSKCRVAWLIL